MQRASGVANNKHPINGGGGGGRNEKDPGPILSPPPHSDSDQEPEFVENRVKIASSQLKFGSDFSQNHLTLLDLLT